MAEKNKLASFRLTSSSTRFFFYTLAIICLILVFWGGPGYFSSRPSKQLWNLGHIPAFALWTWLALRQWERPAAWQPSTQLLALLLFILTGVAITEGGQALLTNTRTGSLDDALNDAAGGLLAFSFWHWRLPGRRLTYALATLTGGILLLIHGGVPLSQALIDEHRARQAFPILADFESPLELDRFTGIKDTHYAIEKGQARRGENSLRINFTQALYSGLFLSYFNGNWQDYDFLVMEIENIGDTPLALACRIHDLHHNQKYKDRFNRQFTLAPGWNTISIPLADIRSAPRDRKMDMAAISDIGLFTTNLIEPRSMKLDYVRLEKNIPAIASSLAIIR